MRKAFCLIASGALALSACSDPVDKAAKARIFSPEDPPKAISSAKDKLPPQDVASDERIARRVLGMGAAEATERLGPHKYVSTVKWEWAAKNRAVKLEETRTLLSGTGGVSGDFHATLENSRNQGVEVIRASGQVYARSRYGKFRHRKRDRGLAERVRDEIYGSIRDFDALVQGRVTLRPTGTVTHQGRTAWRYDVDLAPASAVAVTTSNLPPVQFPRNGADADTARRLRFLDKREVVSADGEVLVDADTSVVVKAKLSGVLKAPGEEDGPEAILRLSIDSETSDIGTEPAISAPKDALPDADKPHGIADALDQFDIPRAGTDAGTATADDEPQDE